MQKPKAVQVLAIIASILSVSMFSCGIVEETGSSLSEDESSVSETTITEETETNAAETTKTTISQTKNSTEESGKGNEFYDDVFTFKTDESLYTLTYSDEAPYDYCFRIVGDNTEKSMITVTVSDRLQYSLEEYSDLYLDIISEDYENVTEADTEINGMEASIITGQYIEDSTCKLNYTLIGSESGSVLQIMSIYYDDEFGERYETAIAALVESVQSGDTVYEGKVFSCTEYSVPEHGNWRIGYAENSYVSFYSTISETPGERESYTAFDADSSAERMTAEECAEDIYLYYADYDQFELIKQNKIDFLGYNAYHLLYLQDNSCYFEYYFFENDSTVFTVFSNLNRTYYDTLHDESVELIKKLEIKNQ